MDDSDAKQQPDDANFDRVFQAVLQSPEVSAQLRATDIDPAALVRFVKKSDRKAIDEELRDAREAWVQSSRAATSRVVLSDKEEQEPDDPYWVLGSNIFAAAVGGLIVAAFSGLLEIFSVPAFGSWGRIALIGGGVAFVLGIILLVFSLRRYMRWNQLALQRKRERVQNDAVLARREYNDKLGEILTSSIRAHLNEMRPVRFSTMLDIHDAPGLSEAHGEGYLIETQVDAQVDALVARFVGGSVGIAGMRGSGKTTLIRRYCDRPAVAGEHSPDFSLMVAAPVDYVSRDFILYLFSALCKAYLEHRGETVFGHATPVLPDALRSSLQSVARSARSAVGGSGDSTQSSKVNADLANEARAYLDQIRFMQTDTSSLGGKVGVKIAEVSGQEQTAKQRVPWTHPEIVDEYRRFLRAVAQEANEWNGRVFIGIDELDKIDQAEHAQKFINELKAVFDVPRVLYMVAVSEDALTSFEMRGLTVRDSFDTAFDEIIGVSALAYRESKKLLAKRVVAMPEAYVALSHCLSGGLPRDLIRAAREIVYRGQQGEVQRDLRSICHTVLSRSLRARLNAVGSRVANQPIASSVSETLYSIDSAISNGLDTGQLVAHAKSLKLAARQTRDTDETPLLRARTVVGSFASYLYFAATVADFFGDEFDEQRMRSAAERREGGVDALAASVRILSTDYRRAWMAIDGFRQIWSMPNQSGS